ncbi:hypothetical protein Trco_002179 [Trichoderma cornu-damae]|uniref:Uncharacterized protein n=1 Tax=Trichoderma cornu-damae TaxID=654480 RepID=A0A9P8QU60_9HYPO|nr:hypothetical protein Trco_002179 [Trichoderma cornu-damae]
MAYSRTSDLSCGSLNQRIFGGGILRLDFIKLDAQSIVVSGESFYFRILHGEVVSELGILVLK